MSSLTLAPEPEEQPEEQSATEEFEEALAHYDGQVDELARAGRLDARALWRFMVEMLTRVPRLVLAEISLAVDDPEEEEEEPGEGDLPLGLPEPLARAATRASAAMAAVMRARRAVSQPIPSPLHEALDALEAAFQEQTVQLLAAISGEEVESHAPPSDGVPVESSAPWFGLPPVVAGAVAGPPAGTASVSVSVSQDEVPPQVAAEPEAPEAPEDPEDPEAPPEQATPSGPAKGGRKKT